MRLWSLVLLAIAALAAVAGFGGFGHDNNNGVMVARVLFGVVLLLFAISLLADRNDPDRRGRHDN